MKLHTTFLNSETENSGLREQLLRVLNQKFISNLPADARQAGNRFTNQTVIANWLTLNGITTHSGTDKIYRNIDAYSNSRLTEIKNELMGIRKPKPLKAFSMGSILHQLILEPELAEIEDYVFLTPAPRRHLLKAQKAALRNRLLSRVLRDEETKIEKVVQWTDTETGLSCKAKVDVLYKDHRGTHLIDLKSTGEGSRAGFLRSCTKYEYERQGAFYLDGIGAASFTVYGIQKRAPYGVFRKRFTKKELEAGRGKYRFILGKTLELIRREIDLSPESKKKRS